MSDSDTSPKALGKADSRYWQQPGKLLTDPRSRFYTAKIQVQGRRENFPLRTANKSTAASKAAKIYGDVAALGWDEALKKHKPDERRSKGALVGDLIRLASELADVRRATLASNVGAFRRIVAAVAKIDATLSRYSSRGAGRLAWIATVESVPLAKITPAAVEAWKLAFVTDNAAGDEIKARAARNSANATLRSAKSLFSKRLLKFIAPALELPAPLPFDGVEFYPRQSMRYVSTMNVETILATARDEFAASDTEAFKVLLLCLYAGLRRNEADKLRWHSIDFERGMIRIEAHTDFAPKAETSLGEVPLDAEVVAILRGMRAREPKAEYVLAGEAVNSNGAWRQYRADETFARLNTWLRMNGVDSQKPLHTLRKEAGSLVCKQGGLFAASRFLRHADVAITAMHYVDQKNIVTVGLGSLLTKEPANIITPDFSASEAAPKTSKSKHARKASA
jgi:integrase